MTATTSALRPKKKKAKVEPDHPLRPNVSGFTPRSQRGEVDCSGLR
jgi:hypothetical protein